MKTSPLILSLDIGSSACKGLLIDESGRLLAARRERYVRQHHAGRVEQDPEAIWLAVRLCLTYIADQSDLRDRIAAITLSAQMSSHLLVDRAGRPLTPFLSWADLRASKESLEMAAQFSPEQLVAELGASLRVGPSWPFPRLKWWSEHEPKLLDRAQYLVQPKDWIIWKMCDVWLSDLSSLRGLAHQETGLTSLALMKWAATPADLCLPIGQSDSIAGTLDDAIARECKLPAKVPVVLGSNDLACAVIGATGLPDETAGFDITGTSEHLGLCLPGKPTDVKPHPLSLTPLGPKHLLCYGVTSWSGSTVEWYWEKFRDKAINAESYSEFEAEVCDGPPGANGLLFLPSLNGERAPWFNPHARGVLFGLTLAHARADMSRAVLEGITFLLRSIQDRLGAKPAQLYVSGGGSAMATWNQIKADILGIPLVTLEHGEAGCLGAAILAARALGLHADLNRAARAMIRPARTFEPNPKLADLYAGRHRQFEKLHQALEPVFAEEAT